MSTSTTHILIVCPRGFANERSVYPIDAELLADATAAVASHNPEGHVSRTRLVEWAAAERSDRRDAHRWTDAVLLRETLYGGPLAITLNV